MDFKDNFIKLFACCLLVKGAKRSMICDVQRGKYRLIPNILFEILTNFGNLNIANIKKEYDPQYHSVINEYFVFLIENEYAFLCSSEENEYFPEMSLEWEKPAIITNCIIDCNKECLHNFNNIAKQLDELGCSALEIRIYENISNTALEEILLSFSRTRLRSIDLLICYDETKNLDYLKSILDRNNRIFQIRVHSSISEERNKIENTNSEVFYVTKKINSSQCCGIVAHEYFSSNILLFTESQKHNTCLNRKISIDVNGEIKNCPSMTKSYGNIKENTLSDALERQGFKDLWFINKDKIDICKDCEFRYVCTDCRAFIKDSNNIYSKPAKCSYNPYEAIWE